MYTWECGLAEKTKVCERLDRICGNTSWCRLFPDSGVEHLVRFKSDHTPIMARLKRPKKKRSRGKKSFEFETAWLLDESCEAAVRNSWVSSESGPMMSRLELLIEGPKGWSGTKFANLGKQIEDVERTLKEDQGKSVSDESIAECKALEKTLEELFIFIPE